MSLASAVQTSSDLDFGAILEGLMLHPESYVNFGRYWWTLKRMLADWAEENGASVDAELIRGKVLAKEEDEVEEHDLFAFLDRFSGREDYMDWIAYANPQPEWADLCKGEIAIEDLEWEENFL